MARFCPKCGAMQDEGSRFCGSCGTPIPEMEAQAPVNPQPEPQVRYAQPEPQVSYAQPESQASYFSQPEPPKKKSNKKVIGIIIAAVALIAAIVIALFATGVIGGSDKEEDGNTPEGVVKALASAFKNYDAEALATCLPAFMFEDEDLDEMIEDLQDSFDEMKEMGVKINISIDGEVKDLTDDDLEELEDQLYEYDIDIDDISDYKKIKIKMTMSYEGEEMQSQSSDLILIKYNGKWYIGGGLDF